MSKKKDIFRRLERDCVNPITVDVVKEYINNLSEQNRGLMYGKNSRRNVK